MKRALIISDSHGLNEEMLAVMDKFSDVNAIFHLGDMQGAAQLIENKARCLSYIVRGNCDREYDIPESRVIDFGGKRIALTHGHRYVGYGGGIDSLRYFGEENNADVVLFGHIHKPVLINVGNLIICNPGSISRPRQYDGFKTFAIMTVEDDGSINICHYTCDISTLGLPVIDEYNPAEY